MEFESGKKLGFNFYAFLFGMFWMLYRKMHRFLLIILLVIIAESTLEFLILEWTNASLQTEQTLNKFSYFIWGSIIGLFANKGYIKMADRKISRILNLNLTQDITEKRIKKAGGTTITPLLVIILLLALVIYLGKQGYLDI